MKRSKDFGIEKNGNSFSFDFTNIKLLCYHYSMIFYFLALRVEHKSIKKSYAISLKNLLIFPLIQGV